MSYGAVHRYFLRTVASQGVLTYSNAQKILDESFSGNYRTFSGCYIFVGYEDGTFKNNPNYQFEAVFEGTEEGRNIINYFCSRLDCDRENTSIEDLSKEINDKISPFQQKIKIVNDEVTSEKVVVFLSLANDNATKSQNMFSEKELDFFRILIEQIMTTESRQISSKYALNLVNKNSKLSKTEAQKLLNTWCRMYYLEEINSNYALGTRAIHEFEQYLLDYMPDTIQKCCLCKHIVFRGYNCPPCGEAVHLRCLSEYLERVKKWPCCRADFHESQLETLNSGGLSQTQRLEESQRIAQRTIKSMNSVDITNEISDDEFEQTLTQTPIPGISQRISKKRKRMILD